MTTLHHAELLEEAADQILLHGLYKGGLRDPDSMAVCAVGAINRAAVILFSGAISWMEAVGLLAERVNPYTPSRHPACSTGLVAEWNDRPERTADEVRDALLLTAKDIRNTLVTS